MTSVQDNLSAGYLSSFERPIGVSVVSKLNRWPYLQELSFAGQLTYSQQTFHGLSDFNQQMTMYSSTSFILQTAFQVIKKFVMNNRLMARLLYSDPALGMVGKQFQSISSFNQIFAVSPDELLNPSAIGAKVTAYGSIG